MALLSLKPLKIDIYSRGPRAYRIDINLLVISRIRVKRFLVSVIRRYIAVSVRYGASQVLRRAVPKRTTQAHQMRTIIGGKPQITRKLTKSVL